MKLIQEASSIVLPKEAKGLRFHYVPPIDPICFAKVRIPADSKKSIQEQIERLKDSADVPQKFADERCLW